MTVGEVVESGLCRIPTLNLAGYLLGGPVRDVAMLGKMPRTIEVVVVVHPVGEHLAGVALIAKVEFVVVDGVELRASLFVEHHVVELDPISLRIHVQLARGEGLVACIAKRLREGGDIRHPQRLVEITVAVRAWRRARHQGAASGDADGALAVGSRKATSVACELIQRGCLDDGVTGDPEERSGPVVSADEQNVRLIWHCETSGA